MTQSEDNLKYVDMLVMSGSDVRLQYIEVCDDLADD